MNRVLERHLLNRQIREFFFAEEFVEVETPLLVPSPGTDVYIDPIQVDVTTRDGVSPRYLHTSPEFAMKRLLGEGHQKIFQLCKAFRDGEQTARHAFEFTILEWYRAGVEVDVIIDDVERLCRSVLPEKIVVGGRDVALAQWPRLSMSTLFVETCGFDILETQTDDSLRAAVDASVGLNARAGDDWDSMFFDLWVRVIDPALEKMGAVFVTDWPARLAVLAERDLADPRRAKRFELFIAGLEIVNGFQELTDPVEQRARFVEDNTTRRSQGRPELPMPEAFLLSLEKMPRSAGVALGVDRLLMLKLGVDEIQSVINPA